MRVGILGATGATGRAVAQKIARVRDVVLIGRDRDRLADAARAHTSDGAHHVESVQAVSIADRAFQSALDRLDVLVQCAPLAPREAAQVARLAVQREAHYLDVTTEAAVAEQVATAAAEAAHRVARTVCCGLGPVGGVLGVLLGLAVAPGAHEVELAYASSRLSTARGSLQSALRVLQGRGDGAGRVLGFPPPFGSGLAFPVPFPDQLLLRRMHGFGLVSTWASLTPRRGHLTLDLGDEDRDTYVSAYARSFDADGEVLSERGISMKNLYSISAELVHLALDRLQRTAHPGCVSPAALVSNDAQLETLPGIRWFRSSVSQPS